jgi:anti-sigma B factor antagonist
MQITRTNEAGIVRLHLEGRFDEFATTGAEQTFAALVKEGARRVVLDLSGVEYVTSSGLRTILMLHRALANQQGVLKVCGLTPFVAQVFDVSNFSTLFEIHPSAEQALRSFE